MRFDAIVIGAGHNGLAAAARLALARRRVLVLEAREEVGGLAARRGFHPGFFAPGVLHDTDLLRPGVVDTLGLGRHGLRIRNDDVPVLGLEPGGKGVLLFRNPSRCLDELSKHDAAGYAAWRGFLGRIGGFVYELLNQPPPALLPDTASDFWEIGKRGLALRRLGKQDMSELIRVLPMPVADWLRESFESHRLQTMLASPAVLGAFAGPHSAGTAATLLLHECAARTSGVEGGPAALVDALVETAKSDGVELRTSARVVEILVERGAVRGVRLEDGEVFEAPVVASATDPKSTMMKLVHPSALPMRVEDEFRCLRARGTSAKLHLALDGELEIPGRGRIERARTGAHIDDLERAFDAVKYRRMSERPSLDLRCFRGSGIAPEGKSVLSILASFVPHDLEGGWTDAARVTLEDRVLAVLEEHAPGIRARVLGQELLTPADLEREYGLSGGHIHHGEHALDQLLFMRPTPSSARYETAVRGLFLVSSGSHPGGGITCAPGMIAATTIAARGD